MSKVSLSIDANRIVSTLGRWAAELRKYDFLTLNRDFPYKDKVFALFDRDSGTWKAADDDIVPFLDSENYNLENDYSTGYVLVYNEDNRRFGPSNQLSENTSDIAQNASDIADNASDIAGNASDISDLQDDLGEITDRERWETVSGYDLAVLGDNQASTDTGLIRVGGTRKLLTNVAQDIAIYSLTVTQSVCGTVYFVAQKPGLADHKAEIYNFCAYRRTSTVWHITSTLDYNDVVGVGNDVTFTIGIVSGSIRFAAQITGTYPSTWYASAGVVMGSIEI